MLPEHLFLEDYKNFLVKANRQTYKALNSVFDRSENHEEALGQAISQVTFGDEFGVDHPMCEKLAIYTQAHRNYLSSLTLVHLKTNKVNWGLRHLRKIEAEPK
jgi:hypothetical protein